jgi:phytoene synthase
MDIERQSYETIEELLQYCYRVASSVGLMCLPVFGCHHPDSENFAVNLGLALQLTNILRDVASDADRGRVYLPLADLRQCGYPSEGFEQRIYNEAFLNVMKMQTTRAKEFYEEAARSLPRQERGKLLPARIMGCIYRGTLEEIVRREYGVFGPKIRLSKTRKAILIMAEVLGRGERTGS